MRRLATFVLAAAIAGTGFAVGLGPLSKSGITDGPQKAFYLTLINPYPQAERFTVDALETASEVKVERVLVFPNDVQVAGNHSRQLLVVVRDLQPGEQFDFRVCAQKPPAPEETVHARVCSTLMARRLAVRPRDGRERSGRLPAPAA